MKKNYFLVIWSMTAAFTKRYFKDKLAVFFTFVFPLIFLFVFGGIFGKSSSASFDVVILQHSKSSFAQSFATELSIDKFIKLNTKATDLESAKSLLSKGEVDAIIEFPEGFGVLNEQAQPSGEAKVLYAEGSEQTAQTFGAIMNGIIDQINQSVTGYRPPLSVKLEPSQSTGLKSFDYIVSGLIGFSILSLSIFGMANSFVSDKKEGALRRLRVAPITSTQLILATMFNRVLVGLVSVSIQLVVAKFAFGFSMRGNYAVLFVFAAFSLVLMFGFGMAIAGWAKTENQAAPLSNLVAFPMMFLSGSFFPRYAMPQWLQSVSNYLPLTPVIDGMRSNIAGTASWSLMMPLLLIMTAWTVIIYTVCFKTFRWE